jgi:hypothetical protein
VQTEHYAGALTKSAEVFTNDPQRPQFTLLMTMVINVAVAAPAGKRIGSFIISPVDRLSMEVPVGLTTGGIFSIYNDSPQPVKITKLEPGGEAFAVTLNALEEGKRYAVNFTASTKLPLGLHHQTVKLLTDSQDTPELKLELDLRVAAPVKVNPTKITFENIPFSLPDYDFSTLSRFAWVTITRGEGLEIKSLTSDLPFIKAKVESVTGNGRTFLLRIGFSDKPAKGRHHGVLKIETNNKDLPVVELALMIEAQ